MAWRKDFWRPSLKRWVLLSAVVPVIALASLSFWGIPKALEYAYQRQQQALVEPLIDQTLRALQPAWIRQDRLSMNETLSQLVERPAISGVALTHLDWSSPLEQGVMVNGVHYTSQLIVGDEVAGKLVLNLSADILEEARTQVIGILGSAALLVVALGLVLGAWWWRRMNHLFRDAVLQWQRLPEEFSPIRKSFSEFDALNTAAAHVNQTYWAEQEAKKALARFISPQADADVLDLSIPTGAQLRSVAVLYIDLVNWREMRDQMTAKQLVALLNQYYFFIRQAAKLYNGEVERYQGQGLTVTFGLSGADDEDTFHAACAGELFLELVYRFNVHHQLSQSPVCEFSLALHSGEVLCTPLSDEANPAWSIVGDVLHHAAILGQHGEQRLLLSNTAQSNVCNRIQLGEHQSVQCDPRDGALPTFWVEALNAPYAELIQRQAERILSMRPITTA